MIGEWAIPWWLETPEGTLCLNYTYPDTKRRFQLVPAKCNANLPVRVTADDVPQGDGAIPHRRWRSGFTVHLAVELLIDPDGDENEIGPEGTQEAACDADLVAMLDLLGLHINAMIRTGLVSGFPNARLFFTPSGIVGTTPLGDRMFDRLQLQTGGAVSLTDGDIGPAVEFDLDTALPYYIEAEETDTEIAGTGSEVVTNAGNTNYYPVVQIHGPTSFAELVNFSIVDLDGNPLVLIYDAGLPGALPIASGHYVEVNFFTGGAFLDGSGANRKAAIDLRFSEFFPLVPGDNDLSIFGASATILSNGAFA